MPTETSTRPAALVVEVAAEEQVHQLRPGDEHHQRHAAREAGDRDQRDVHAAPERVALAARAQTREVGEDRGLDRLEELQRRAGDQQHVEGEAGERRAAGALGRLYEQRTGVQEGLLAEHDQRARRPRSRCRGASVNSGSRAAGSSRAAASS